MGEHKQKKGSYRMGSHKKDNKIDFFNLKGNKITTFRTLGEFTNQLEASKHILFINNIQPHKFLTI